MPNDELGVMESAQRRYPRGVQVISMEKPRALLALEGRLPSLRLDVSQPLHVRREAVHLKRHLTHPLCRVLDLLRSCFDIRSIVYCSTSFSQRRDATSALI